MIARRAAAFVAIALLTACGHAVAGPGGARSDEGGDSKAGTIPVPALSDIVGFYTAVNTAQSPKPLVPGSLVTLQITADSVILRAGCNTMSGPATATDSRLVITDLVTTEMACAPELMDQDTWLATHLTKRPQISRSGPYVSLVWADGWLGFDRSVAPAPPATGDPNAPVSNTPSS